MIVLVPVVWEKDAKRKEQLTVLCFIPLTIYFIPFHSTFQLSSRPSFLFYLLAFGAKQVPWKTEAGWGEEGSGSPWEDGWGPIYSGERGPLLY